MLVTEDRFLEAVGAAAAAGLPPEVAGIVRDAVIAVEETQLRRALRDYARIQRVRSAGQYRPGCAAAQA
jgi:hypothetical protein